MSSDIPLFRKIQLLVVDLWMIWLNFWLNVFLKVLFGKPEAAPKNVLIYKVGNIGDIVCAVPALIAIRRNFREAKITLLTSPGKRGAPGAKELLDGVRYLDEVKVYYGDEVDSLSKKKEFVRNLRSGKYDLFIQLPDDLASFRTLLRNLLFAKLIGSKSALGFKVRTVQLFKKAQVDYTMQKTEVESLLELLKESGLKVEKVEYDFNISSNQKDKIDNLLKEKWRKIGENDVIAAFSVGGKRAANQWPVERFADVARYLQDRHNGKIVVVGGEKDVQKAGVIKSKLKEENVLVTAGELDILETVELLRHCSFLISNSTGTVHLAAAVGLPVIGLFTVRDVFGRWFPYGPRHKILAHRFIECNYKNDECIEKSAEMISVEEVIAACEQVI